MLSIFEMGQNGAVRASLQSPDREKDGEPQLRLPFHFHSFYFVCAVSNMAFIFFTRFETLTGAHRLSVPEAKLATAT